MTFNSSRFIRGAVAVGLSALAIGPSPSALLAQGLSPSPLRALSVRFTTESVKLGDLFGLTTSIADRYPSKARLAVARIRQTGTDWVREEFTADHLHSNWNKPYDFHRYDAVVKREVAAGFHILGLLDYNNTFHGRDHAWMGHQHIIRLTNSFVRFAIAVAYHYRKQIEFWQIWNEPNISLRWQPYPNAGDYAYLLRETYTAIKKVNPAARIVMAGPTTGNNSNAVGFVAKVARQHALFDVVALQPYTPWPGPEVEAMAQALRALGKPVWFTEVGWPGEAGCAVCGDPEVQAEDVTATFLSAAVSGLQRVFWYDFRDDGVQPEFWQHFGIVEHDFRAKPAYHAYVTSLYLLRGASLTGSAQPTPLVWIYRFKNHRHVFSVLWNASSFTQAVNLDWRGRLANIDDVTGNHVYATYGHRLQMQVPPYSVYYLIPLDMGLR